MQTSRQNVKEWPHPRWLALIYNMADVSRSLPSITWLSYGSRWTEAANQKVMNILSLLEQLSPHRESCREWNTLNPTWFFERCWRWWKNSVKEKLRWGGEEKCALICQISTENIGLKWRNHGKFFLIRKRDIKIFVTWGVNTEHEFSKGQLSASLCSTSLVCCKGASSVLIKK